MWHYLVVSSAFIFNTWEYWVWLRDNDKLLRESTLTKNEDALGVDMGDGTAVMAFIISWRLFCSKPSITFLVGMVSRVSLTSSISTSSVPTLSGKSATASSFVFNDWFSSSSALTLAAKSAPPSPVRLLICYFIFINSSSTFEWPYGRNQLLYEELEPPSNPFRLADLLAFVELVLVKEMARARSLNTLHFIVPAWWSLFLHVGHCFRNWCPICG